MFFLNQEGQVAFNELIMLISLVFEEWNKVWFLINEFAILAKECIKRKFYGLLRFEETRLENFFFDFFAKIVELV